MEEFSNSIGFMFGFSSNSVTVKEEIFLYPFESFVAEFGGCLGLFLGVSFLREALKKYNESFEFFQHSGPPGLIQPRTHWTGDQFNQGKFFHSNVFANFCCFCFWRLPLVFGTFLWPSWRYFYQNFNNYNQ